MVTLPFTEDWESNSFATNGWTTVGGMAIGTDYKRSGTYGCNGSGGSGNSAYAKNSHDKTKGVIGVWVRDHSSSAYGEIIGMGFYGGGPSGCSIKAGDKGLGTYNLCIRYVNSGENWHVEDTGSPALGGSWVYLELEVDPATATAKFYRDGELITTITDLYSSLDASKFAIGGWSHDSSSSTSFDFDDLLVSETRGTVFTKQVRDSLQLTETSGGVVDINAFLRSLKDSLQLDIVTGGVDESIFLVTSTRESFVLTQVLTNALMTVKEKGRVDSATLTDSLAVILTQGGLKRIKDAAQLEEVLSVLFTRVKTPMDVAQLKDLLLTSIARTIELQTKDFLQLHDQLTVLSSRTVFIKDTFQASDSLHLWKLMQQAIKEGMALSEVLNYIHTKVVYSQLKDDLGFTEKLNALRVMVAEQLVKENMIVDEVLNKEWQHVQGPAKEGARVAERLNATFTRGYMNPREHIYFHERLSVTLTYIGAADLIFLTDGRLALNLSPRDLSNEIYLPLDN